MKSTCILALVSLGLATAHAQPTLLSSSPTNMAAGVSTTAPVVFVFSKAMNPAATVAQFMDVTAPTTPLLFAPAWTSGNTVLTCTPAPAWPANKMIVWVVGGENPAGDPLGGDTAGMFTTGNSGGGDCTNEVGSLTLGKGLFYHQGSAAAPIQDTNIPCIFVACTTLACSNWTTTNINLTPPGGAAISLPATTIPGHYTFSGPAGSLTNLEIAYPNGSYLFTLQSGTGNLPCTVAFPASLAWPNAPHLTNYTAAQAMDPTQPFVLGWDAFTNGTAADCIAVELYGGVFQTPALGEPGALPGTARSVTIPANTLQPGQAYDGALTFYDLVLNTNATGYISLVYRAATTEFSLATASGAPALAITRSGNSILVSWPSPSTGWTLQQCGDLKAGGWTASSLAISDNGTIRSVAVSPPATNVFFRLSK